MGIISEVMQQAVFLSLLAGLVTVIGGLIVFYFGVPNKSIMAIYLGLAAGVMTMVTIDLINHSLEIDTIKFTVIGIITGIIFMLIIAKFVIMVEGILAVKGSITDIERLYRRIGWTMLFGIAAHNIPEGIAIAAGDAFNNRLGLIIIIAIALHNIPEGIGVTAPLLKSGVNKVIIIISLILVSLCVPLGTIIGCYMIGDSAKIISIAMSFAAGAMIYIVGKELLPPAYSQHKLLTCIGFIIGAAMLFVAMMLMHTH